MNKLEKQKIKELLIRKIKEAVEYMKLVEKGERKTQSLKDLLKS